MGRERENVSLCLTVRKHFFQMALWNVSLDLLGTRVLPGYQDSPV